jgi:hypothetical protein
MNFSSKTLNTSNQFLQISLESPTQTAGSRLKGTLLLNTLTPSYQSKLKLTSTGYENLSAISVSGVKSEYNNEIFHMSNEISSWDCLPASQLVFPFSFKLPFYAPASFDFSNSDMHGTHLEASVVYSLRAELTEDEKIVVEDFCILNVLSNKARLKPQESKVELNLSTCCCFHKGTSRLTLSQKDPVNAEYGQKNRFHLEVNWEQSKGKIKEIIGCVVYQLQVNIPGDKSYEFTQEIFEFNHSNSFLAKNGAVLAFNEFDVLVEGLWGDNASSNHTAMISSSYRAEAQVVFLFNFSEKRIKIDLPVHVNPRDVPEKDYFISGDWSPETQSMTSLFLLNKTGQNIFSPSKSSLLMDSS